MNQIDKLESQISEARSQSEDLALALRNVRSPAQKYEPSFGAYDFLKSELAKLEDEAQQRELLLKAESAIAHSNSQIAGLEAELAELRQQVSTAKEKVKQAIARYEKARTAFGAEILEFQKSVAEVRSDLLPGVDQFSRFDFPIDGVQHFEKLPQARQTENGAVAIFMADSGAAKDIKNFSGFAQPKRWYESI